MLCLYSKLLKKYNWSQERFKQTHNCYKCPRSRPFQQLTKFGSFKREICPAKHCYISFSSLWLLFDFVFVTQEPMLVLARRCPCCPPQQGHKKQNSPNLSESCILKFRHHSWSAGSSYSRNDCRPSSFHWNGMTTWQWGFEEDPVFALTDSILLSTFSS